MFLKCGNIQLPRGKNNKTEEYTMAKTWKVKALTVTGTATERVENGIHIYDPGKQEWLVIKEFDDFEKAENWMADYIRKNHFYYGDFKITR
jgi:hypothetical protein